MLVIPGRFQPLYARAPCGFSEHPFSECVRLHESLAGALSRFMRGCPSRFHAGGSCTDAERFLRILVYEFVRLREPPPNTSHAGNRAGGASPLPRWRSCTESVCDFTNTRFLNMSDYANFFRMQVIWQSGAPSRFSALAVHARMPCIFSKRSFTEHVRLREPVLNTSHAGNPERRRFRAGGSCTNAVYLFQTLAF